MASNAGPRRNNPFSRTASPSPGPTIANGRPKSMIMSSPPSSDHSPTHSRHQSYSSLVAPVASNNPLLSRHRSSSKSGSSSSNTFAPSFIKAEAMQRGADVVKSIEGENDFSGKRYVWLNDPNTAFVKGWIVEELDNNKILVQCEDGTVCIFGLITIPCANTAHSNDKLVPTTSTKSIPRSLTRQMIWRNLHILTKHLLFTICTCGISLT